MNTPCPTCGHVKKEKKAPDKRVKEIIDYYHGRYVVTFASTPPLVGGRDAMAIKRLLGNWSYDEIRNSVDDYFACAKSFFIENGFDIPRLEKFMAEKGVRKNGTGLQVTGQRGESARDARNREAREDEKRLLHSGGVGFSFGGAYKPYTNVTIGPRQADIQGEVIQGPKVEDR